MGCQNFLFFHLFISSIRLHKLVLLIQIFLMIVATLKTELWIKIMALGSFWVFQWPKAFVYWDVARVIMPIQVALTCQKHVTP
jgi:hypothetical protein